MVFAECCRCWVQISFLLIENICKNQLNMKNKLKFSISLIRFRLHVLFFHLTFFSNCKSQHKRRKKKQNSMRKYEKFLWNGGNYFYTLNYWIKFINTMYLSHRNASGYIGVRMCISRDSSNFFYYSHLRIECELLYKF